MKVYGPQRTIGFHLLTEPQERCLFNLFHNNDHREACTTVRVLRREGLVRPGPDGLELTDAGRNECRRRAW